MVEYRKGEALAIKCLEAKGFQVVDQTQKPEYWRKDVDKRFRKGNEHFDQIDEGNRITQQAILALIDHAIDNNHTEKLIKAQDDLQNYLLNKQEAILSPERTSCHRFARSFRPGRIRPPFYGYAGRFFFLPFSNRPAGVQNLCFILFVSVPRCSGHILQLSFTQPLRLI